MNINFVALLKAGSAVIAAVAQVKLLGVPVDFKLDNDWYTISPKAK